MLIFCVDDKELEDLQTYSARTAQTTRPVTIQNPHRNRSRARHAEVMKLCVSFYFEDIRGAQNELERVCERFLKLDELLRGIDYSRKLGVDVSSSNSATDDMIARLEAYEAYTDVYIQVSDKIKQARRLVTSVEGGALLWAHYIDGVKWNVLALRERVDRRTIYRHRDNAIAELYCLMPEEYRRYAIPNAEVY